MSSYWRVYTDAIAKIHIENDVSNTIYIERGVRQGDTISPKTFTTVTVNKEIKETKSPGKRAQYRR